MLILLVAGAGFLVWQKNQAGQTQDGKSAEVKEEEEKYLKQLADFQKQQEKDTYGGKTPEETLKLYLDARQAKNIELASRYYLIENQQRERKNLEDFLKGDVFSYEKWTGFMVKATKVKEEGNTASFDYKIELEDEVVDPEFPNIKIPPGTYTNTFYFVKLPSGIWKIESP